MLFRRATSFAFGSALVATAALAGSFQTRTAAGWPTHGGNSQHSAQSSVPAQSLDRILWSTPLDQNPQYNGDVLYAHYGSPVVAPDNIVVLPVKTGATSGFQIEGRNGATGALLWKETTDYITPDHNWFPTLGPTIANARALWPRKAGLVASRSVQPLSKNGLTSLCFYGMSNYLANPSAYDQAVRISSPIVTGEDGSIFFTYRVNGSTPLSLTSGIAMIRQDGTASYLSGADASGNPDYVRPKLNSAPALNGNLLYAVFKKANSDDGVLVGIDIRNFKPLYQVPLNDPKSGNPSWVDDDGTACPTVGPDGDVYYGVLEAPFPSHHYRGWLLHFNRTLATLKTPGSFGWDDSASIVPSSIVPSYTGTSPYLLMTKYNNYVGAGDGVNRIAILDPNDTQIDPYSGVTTMKEVLTKVGPTPDTAQLGSFPNAVREWCINTAVVDVKSKSVLVNNEDGIVYRWNLVTNQLDQQVRITAGLGQAYTPTLMGPTGIVYAASNGRLFAVGH